MEGPESPHFPPTPAVDGGLSKTEDDIRILVMLIPEIIQSPSIGEPDWRFGGNLANTSFPFQCSCLLGATIQGTITSSTTCPCSFAPHPYSEVDNDRRTVIDQFSGWGKEQGQCIKTRS
ncbi:hypothetical protein FA13DRAFT_1729136 [Coprinellus micaceus]|uniref:Uncharacterized protein n=1 Tax=Coprinellus micaceus TaxID=71717 RepID=A0A4Y7TJZ4_COPMI|nr:hypothetical protein FA13DRAFT_1729136 [Coprinellus micaceus]